MGITAKMMMIPKLIKTPLNIVREPGSTVDVADLHLYFSCLVA
ncbi:hypothetical protein MGWOODY_Clf2307 [hydrothermal vent metagenome]|uniref:Uncharacterized protein n=1 Tax=hydrothermal vent metagenome TaxID=652676 RepID=A0A170QB87_9ZZZZ